MPLRGRGFLVMWHDIDAQAEAEYHLWHTREHMPERLALPGFLRGRRGVNWDLTLQRYLTVYEGSDLGVFRSPEYMRSLNQPSAWSSKMAPSFRNFLRVACETVVSRGAGVGGAIATYRGDFAAGEGEREFRARLERCTEQLLAIAGVSAVHIALARPEYSTIITTETKLRPAMHEKSFDALVMVESVGLRELTDLHEQLAGHVSRDLQLREVRGQVYDMAFLLGRDEGS